MYLHLLLCMKEQAHIWAHVAPKLELGTVWSASVCVSAFSLRCHSWKGKTSNLSLCLLIGVETTLCSVIDLYLLRNTMVSESIRQLKDIRFHLAYSQHSWVLTVVSVKSNWEMQISLWHLEEWTVTYFVLVGWQSERHTLLFLVE